MERYTYFDGGKWRMRVGDTEYSGKETVRLAAYEETGLVPEAVEHLKLASMGKAIAEIKEFEGVPVDRLRELAKAEKEGRLVVLPRLHGKKLLRDGLEFEPNHWNITLTAFAHNQPTKSGKRVGLFSICEAAEAALEEREAIQNVFG